MPIEVILIAIVLGIVTGFIVTGVMKGQLKTVRRQSGAGSYVCPGSLHLTHSVDHFLYQNVTRVPRAKNKK